MAILPFWASSLFPHGPVFRAYGAIAQVSPLYRRCLQEGAGGVRRAAFFYVPYGNGQEPNER